MRFRGVVYRAHDPRWSWAPLSGEGARLYGGRFNRRGVPALYTSLAMLTAIWQSQPVGRPLQPLLLCAYQVDAEPIFDAANTERRRGQGVTLADLACPTWREVMFAGGVPASQALADRLIRSGYVGMRVPSLVAGAGASDLNLVMWKWGPRRPARVILIDDDRRLG